MSNKITHTGIVHEVAGRHVTVRITQLSACAACQAARHCRSVEARERLVDVVAGQEDHYRVGDRVCVTMTAATGWLALLLAMGVPLLLLGATIVAVHLAGGSDGQAALSGLASLIPYYILLYALRNKVRRSVTFAIEKTDR